MLWHAWLVVVLAAAAASCAAVERPGIGGHGELFAHRTATSDVVLLWNCRRPASGLLRLEGVAHNPWQAQPIRYLELQLVGIDTHGRQTAEAAGRVRDIQILTNQRSPFELDLTISGTEARFDLYYQYLFNHEYDTTMLAGPPTVSPRLYAQTHTGMVRDACSPTQHLAR